MNIAIINHGVSNHFVCLGVLLDLLKGDNITVYTLNDPNDWLTYYRTLYSFTVIYNTDIIVSKYDKLIKLTSNDNCLINNETISFVHVMSNLCINNSSSRYISCTPYISGDNISYILPIFRPNIKRYETKTVLLIGYYLQSSIDEDTENFIKNNNEYTFIFITWGDSSYKKLTDHSNVRVLHDVKTPTMFQLIAECKFMLSKKYINYHIYSGQLGLAVSFEKPIIIDSKTAGAYKIPGIVFNENYTDIGKLDDVTEEAYERHIEDLRLFKNEVSENNRDTMKRLIPS